ncbi:hypothetical protein XFF6166_120003 [Xanthomonas citri pv. fuscans]|nr:hypothetical protein XFF6166_120003 [Xanthomonas citri pv. fuscans]SON95559.1 hypothetical protein XFF7767_10105 [Xanthomonas citri pv. fuscans]SON99352.1 hypothetical protein XFF6960_160103 [Xanthomonas citri pv. fuscans]SOO10640.1 hypothetical protein XFF6970_60104 [Xanthomonas citri pv. fuscans]SOO13195.1 hypothetical protein XFF7766_140002 [Xanthomonas citri pv. fuscans]
MVAGNSGCHVQTFPVLANKLGGGLAWVVLVLQGRNPTGGRSAFAGRPRTYTFTGFAAP